MLDATSLGVGKISFVPQIKVSPNSLSSKNIILSHPTRFLLFVILSTIAASPCASMPSFSSAFACAIKAVPASSKSAVDEILFKNLFRFPSRMTIH